MARQIRDLKDNKTGVKFFPKTHVNAVVDNDGNQLDAILKNKMDVPETVAESGGYVLAFDANGNPIKISRASLANALAGELSIDARTETDLNNLTDIGMYLISDSADHSPATELGVTLTPFCILNVTKNFTSITQTLYTRENNGPVFVRIKSSSKWYRWQRIDDFGANTAAELSAVVANEISTTNTLMPTGGVYASTQLWEGGIRWARCNVGANTETDYGDMFVFGCTNPIRIIDDVPIYSTDDYDLSPISKINRELKPNEDAATVNMGAGWSLPTKEDFDDLIANTDQEFTTINGVKGCKFIDKRDENNYVFFPAAGYISNTDTSLRNRQGHYQIKTYRSLSQNYLLYFNESSSSLSVSVGARNIGRGVRGVLK